MMDGLLEYLLYLYSNKVLVLTMTAAEPMREDQRRLQYLVPHDSDNLNECGQTRHPVYRYLNAPLCFPRNRLSLYSHVGPVLVNKHPNFSAPHLSRVPR